MVMGDQVQFQCVHYLSEYSDILLVRKRDHLFLETPQKHILGNLSFHSFLPQMSQEYELILEPLEASIF